MLGSYTNMMAQTATKSRFIFLWMCIYFSFFLFLYILGCPKQYFLEAIPTGPSVSFQSKVERWYDGSYGSFVAAFMLGEVAYYSKFTERVSSWMLSLARCILLYDVLHFRSNFLLVVIPVVLFHYLHFFIISHNPLIILKMDTLKVLS